MTVKASQIIKSVKELAAEKPKQKAECKYFHGNGRPCCIVGGALYRNGVKRKDLQITDRFGYSDDLNEFNSLRPLADTGLVEVDVDDETFARLVDVQTRQDNGAPWGEAIKALGE